MARGGATDTKLLRARHPGLIDRSPSGLELRFVLEPNARVTVLGRAVSRSLPVALSLRRILRLERGCVGNRLLD
jgi:hypothetical protein